jgi:hypothetical protein
MPMALDQSLRGFSSKPERSMSNPDQIPASLRASLNDVQIAWLIIQARTMRISCTEFSVGILNEWLSNHPAMLQGRSDDKAILRDAFEEFVRRHFTEYLPVPAIGELSDS